MLIIYTNNKKRYILYHEKLKNMYRVGICALSVKKDGKLPLKRKTLEVCGADIAFRCI